MSMSGMNTESIKTVSSQLTSQGNEVTHVARAVDSILSVARQNWRGENLRQFDARWTGQYRTSCLRLADELRDLARTAAKNASEQEKTSRSLEGGGGVGGLVAGAIGAVKTLLPDAPGFGVDRVFPWLPVNPDGTPDFWGGGPGAPDPMFPFPRRVDPGFDLPRLPFDPDPGFRIDPGFDVSPDPWGSVFPGGRLDPNDIATTWPRPQAGLPDLMPSWLVTPSGTDGESLFTSGMKLADSINNMELLHGVSWKELPDAETGSALISSLAYLPDAVHAFSDAAGGNLTPENYLDFAGKTFDLGGTLLGKFGTTPAGEITGAAMGKVAGTIGVAMDLGNAYEAYSDGDPYTGTYDLVHGGVAAVGVAYPPVALGLAAWDSGVAVGTFIAESPPMQQYEDNLVAYGAAHDGDIATRYDIGKRGVEAIGNIVSDGWHGLFG